MELPLSILEKIDIVNLLAMAALFWIYHSRLDKKFEAIDRRFEAMDQKFDRKFEAMEKRMDERFRKMDERFDKMDEKITDIDRRLCRLEGAFASKDCCMIKDDRQLRKAE